MRRLIAYGAAHPWIVVIGLTLVTALAGTRLPQLRIHISAEGMMVENDPARLLYERVRQTFPADEGVIIFLRDDALLSAEKLGLIRDRLATINALPFVKKTISLFSVNNVKMVRDEVISRPFLRTLPTTPEEAEQIRRDALGNPFIANTLLSKDGRSMAINVLFKPGNRGPVFDRLFTNAIDRAIAPLETQLQEVFPLGPQYVREAISEKIQTDQARILPWSLAALLMALVFTLRRVNGALVPLMTAGISIVWTLAFMVLLGIPINVMTSIVPALLVIIGSTEDVHLLSEYYAGIGDGLDKGQSLDRVSRGMGTAVLLTAITTYLGFVSITANDIALLYQFGLVASTGILFNFLVTALLVPAWLRLLDRGRPGAQRIKPGNRLLPRLAGALVDGVTEHPRITLVCAVLVALGAGYWARAIQVDNDPLSYFDARDTLIQRANTLQENLSGMNSFSVVVRSDIEGTFLKSRYLLEIKRLQDHMEQTGSFDKTISFADYLAFVNTIMEDWDPEELVLPETDDAVREYMLFIDQQDVADYVSRDFSQARILVRHNIGSSYRLRKAVEDIEQFARRDIDPGLRVDVTGDSILQSRAADTMAEGQARSLLLMIFVIWLIVSLLFINARAGMLAVVPNLFPIIILFGVMGYLRIPMDTSTAMVAAIALGICVDDTMHFMVRYHHHTRALGDQQLAIQETVRAETVPMISTSLSLAAGFAVLALSSFPPVVHFGLLSAMVMLLALLATLIVLPILLNSICLITLYDLLTLQLKNKVIEQCALFRDMRPSHIKKLVLISEVRRYVPGEPIIRQGDPGDEMYVILDGDVEVSKDNPDGTRDTLPDMGTGQVFGEMALVARTPRTASITARTPTQVLALKWDGIHRIARFYPRISSRLFLNLSSILSKRLAGSTNNLVRSLEKTA